MSFAGIYREIVRLDRSLARAIRRAARLLPLIEPDRCEHRRGLGDLLGNHGHFAPHQRTIEVRTALFAGLRARRPIGLDYATDQRIALLDFRDCGRPYRIDLLEVYLRPCELFNFADRTIDGSFEPRMHPAILLIAIEMDGRMQRLRRVAGVVREISREQNDLCAIATAPRLLNSLCHRLDRPRQGAGSLKRAR